MKNAALTRQRRNQQKKQPISVSEVKPLADKTPVVQTLDYLLTLHKDHRVRAIRAYVANHPETFRSGNPYAGVFIAKLGNDRARLFIGADSANHLEIGIKDVWTSSLAGSTPIVDYPAQMVTSKTLGNAQGLTASPKDIDRAIDKTIKALANDAPIVEDFSS